MKHHPVFLVLPALFFAAASAAHAQEPQQPAAPGLSAASRFFRIGVQHYDAAVIADLATRQDPIVIVPPNFVIPDAGFAPALSGGPAVITPGAPAPQPAPNALSTAAPAATPGNNRLPRGVQRIYALRADNSLVIQTTPDASYFPSEFSPIR